jgi:hypothetical protein
VTTVCACRGSRGTHHPPARPLPRAATHHPAANPPHAACRPSPPASPHGTHARPALATHTPRIYTHVTTVCACRGSRGTHHPPARPLSRAATHHPASMHRPAPLVHL